MLHESAAGIRMYLRVFVQKRSSYRGMLHDVEQSPDRVCVVYFVGNSDYGIDRVETDFAFDGYSVFFSSRPDNEKRIGFAPDDIPKRIARFAVVRDSCPYLSVGGCSPTSEA